MWSCVNFDDVRCSGHGSTNKTHILKIVYYENNFGLRYILLFLTLVLRSIWFLLELVISLLNFQIAINVTFLLDLLTVDC